MTLSKRKLLQELEPFLLETSLTEDGNIVLNYAGMPQYLFNACTVQEALTVTCLFGYTVKFGKGKFKIKSYSYQEHRERSRVYYLGNIPSTALVTGKRTISATIVLEAA